MSLFKQIIINLTILYFFIVLYKVFYYIYLMFKAYKYRIYPTEKQKTLINKHIGSCRFVYNLALETKILAYLGNKQNLSAFDLIKQLPDLKKELSWLMEVGGQSLQTSIHHMDSSFKKFFKGAGFPKFKNKNSKQSFLIPQYIDINFKTQKLKISKFREGIKIRLDRYFKGVIKNVTISRTPTGKYFASILVDTGIEKPKKIKVKEKTTIGLDLGLKDFIILSNGEKIENPRFLKKSLSKLKYVQRKYSKYKGKQTKKHLSLLHEKVADQRKDFLHKLSTKLISENQTIAVEDLNVKGMKSRCNPKEKDGKFLPNEQSKKVGLNRSISDAGWSAFILMLEYKADWYGKNILKIGRFEPSSKLCSNCGFTNRKLTLGDREWTCPNCNTSHDRDINAAKNIKAFALKKLVSGIDTKNQNELPTLVGVMTSEVQ